MPNITKLVDKNKPALQRSQVFTQADATAGDIVLVHNSLGKAARVCIIEAVGAMTVRFNVQRTVYPERTQADGLVIPGVTAGVPNLAKGVSVVDESSAVVTIAANSTFTLDNDLPVSDIQIVSAGGNFEIFVA